MKKGNIRGLVRKTLAAIALSAMLVFLPASSVAVFAAENVQTTATTETEQEQEVLGAKRLLTAEETMNTYPGLIIILLASVGTAISAVTPRIVIKKYQ